MFEEAIGVVLFSASIACGRYLFRKGLDEQIENAGVSLHINLLQEFRKNGVVVIPGVLTKMELLEIRQGFHNYLKTIGVR
jgi:hypothetical protein